MKMDSSITNAELGVMRHREYEAEASRYWEQGASYSDEPTLSRKHKLVLALSGAVLTLLLIAQMQVF
jgi:hypothetical protein